MYYTVYKDAFDHWYENGMVGSTENCHELDLINYNIKDISSILRFDLLVLVLEKVHIPYLPDISNMQLLKLRLSDVGLAIVPECITNITTLVELYLSYNHIEVVPDLSRLTNLNHLSLRHNNIRILPQTMDSLVNLKELFLENNSIQIMPAFIGTFVNLEHISIHGNPIVYIAPNTERLLHRLEHQYYIRNDFYTDRQNVHNHTVQKCIKQSIFNLISQIQTEKDVMTFIAEDTVLTKMCKEALITFSGDNEVHSELGVTFKDVLVAVWNRIMLNQHSQTIKEILITEMMDSMCKCFTGRISRLINCLNGFDELVNIKIPDNENIGNIISAIRHNLEITTGYNQGEHIKLAREKLKIEGYDEPTIEEWISFI